MPSDARINRQKRDRIVTHDMLHSSRDRIIQYWQMLYREAPTRFRTELGQKLLGSDLSPGNWESAAFATLSEVVETVACQRGIERWSISSL